MKEISVIGETPNVRRRGIFLRRLCICFSLCGARQILLIISAPRSSFPVQPKVFGGGVPRAYVAGRRHRIEKGRSCGARAPRCLCYRMRRRFFRSAAPTSRAGRNSASPSRAPCTGVPKFIFSTTRFPRSIIRRTNSSAPRSERRRAARRPSSSPSASAPSATADLIVVLDEGKVVGKGTHDELMQNCGVYREIAYSQLSEEELAGMHGEVTVNE